MKKLFYIAVVLVLTALLLTACVGCGGKPVIYLYPEEPTEVTVKVDIDGVFTSTYPAYGNGWTVTAQPDGTLTDAAGREYYCLFWEALLPAAKMNFDEGWCVAGSY